MRKLYWSLAKRVHRLGRRFAVHERLGMRWLLDNRNWIDQQLLIGRPYETEQLAQCRALIREHGLTRFYDIGANFGLYSMLLAGESGLTGVDAFEPLPRNADQLAANLFLNGLSGRVRLHRLALSDTAGVARLHVDERSTGVSTLLDTPPAGTRRDYSAHLEVETRPFDALFSQGGERVLMKIDVEGAELAVLTGMRDYLRRNRVWLQVESFGTGVAEQLADLGYRRIGAVGPDAYYCNDDAG